MAADLTIQALAPKTASSEAASAAARPGRVREAAEPAQKFEAFVLQMFIQEMMPETPEGVYGSGISGDFWKSMMAEKVAEQVAERGSVGIANYLNHVGPTGIRPAATASADVASHLATMGNAMTATLNSKPSSGE